MKILFINHNVAWSGGTFFRAFYFARYMARRGHDCTLLTISKKNRFWFKEYEREGVRVVETPDLLPGIGRTGWDPWDTMRRIGWLLQHRNEFDLVHALDSRPAVILPALILKNFTGMPLVMDWADWWGRGGLIHERGYGLIDKFMEPVETWFEEHFRKNADATTVISTSLQQRAIRLGVKPESILLIPQGCDEEKFLCVGRETARSRLGLPEDVYMVGYLGKLLSTDQPLLVDTIRMAAKRIPKLRLFHIGMQSHDAPEDLLENGQLIQTGKVPLDMLGYYLCASNIFILPLRDTLGNQARWPSKINDYLAAGRPIVATRVSDVVDYFERYKIGLLAEPRAEDLADQILRLYEDESAEEMGHNALLLAQTELSWEKLIDKLDDLYQNVILDKKKTNKSESTLVRETTRGA